VQLAGWLAGPLIDGTMLIVLPSATQLGQGGTTNLSHGTLSSRMT